MKQSTPKSKLIQVLLLAAGIVSTLVVLFWIASKTQGTRTSEEMVEPAFSEAAVPTDVIISTNTSEVSSEPDYSTTRLSENDLYRVSYVVTDGMIPVNQMHQWTLHIETTNSQPVENATIFVDGDMPEHGHGLPTQPQMTKYLGNGDYLIEGVKFQMGGWWVMDFTITANGQSDEVHFNILLN